MTSEVKQLIDETIELTGADLPALLDDDAPILRTSDHSLYLIGLVGGKDVGKSSLVNALVGQSISAATSHGPGTESVIAYAHESARDELKELLDRELPAGRYSIITHRNEQLKRQVLLDLPDIDSRYGDHIQITRRMLKHMLYPIWIQSVEKYADQRPGELLAAVAEGNDPRNFLFCLNKADQLKPSDAQELARDYASRIARLLQMPEAPQAFLISAARPDQFDLPQLRQMLSKERSTNHVIESRNLAQKRQDRSLFGWIERQRLPERAAQLKRLEHDAQEIIASRIAVPLLEVAIPRLLDDPGQRMAMLAPATRIRLSRWPIVNAIDALLSPLLALVQKNLSAASSGSIDPDAYMDQGITVSSGIQSAFAQLQQLHPQLGALDPQAKLWEPLHADLAAADLRARFAGALERQRRTIIERAAGRFGVLFAPIRWLLTIGALLWFPIVQPILSIMLQEDTWHISRQALRVTVDVLSVSHLLQCATFLLLWFGILWMLLRWSTQRRLNRLIESWKLADADEDLSLAGQTMQWIDELTEPIRRRRQRIEHIIHRAAELKAQLSVPSASAPIAPAESRFSPVVNPA